MAGTFAERVQLGSSNDFQNLCKVAVMVRAKAMTDDTTKQTIEQINFYFNLLTSPDAFAVKVAWLLATVHPTISAAAPDVPTDANIQTAVNSALTYLLKQ